MKTPFQIKQPPAQTAGAPSTPFSTADGRPKVTDAAGSPGLDVQREPSGHGDRTPPADRMQSRPQPQPPATMPTPTDPMARANRSQGAPRSASERVNPASIPAGGTHFAPTAPAYRAGTGSVGNAQRPFKLKG